MTDAKPVGLPAKESTRPAYGGWAPGDYMNRCVGCRSIFIGAKRAPHCADCAYALPDTKAALDTERAARLAAEARVKVLEEALMRLVMAHQVRIFVARNLDVDTSALTAARAALKEPANG